MKIKLTTFTEGQAGDYFNSSDLIGDTEKILREEKPSLYKRAIDYFNDIKQEIKNAFRKYDNMGIWKEY